MANLVSAGERYISSPIEDGLLIARSMDDRLFVFNGTARYIWERVVEGVEESDIPALIAAYYGISLTQAQIDFYHTLQRWRDDGLIRSPGTRHHYEIAGIAFDIRYGGAAIAEALTPTLSHLASETPRRPELEIDLECRDVTTIVRANGVETRRAHDPDSLIATILSDLFRYVSEKTEWVMSLHAAAVGTAGGCVMMPGASGAGKSSLTAALMSLDDMQFVADDLVLLAGAKLDVVPVPLPIALKSGSWEALYPILPELAGCPIYRRFNSECRYWVPPRERIAREPMPVKAIVIPRYVQGAETILTPERPIEGFGHMTSAPSVVRGPITGAAIKALAQFAHSVPTYTLTYGNVADGRWAVRDLLRK